MTSQVPTAWMALLLSRRRQFRECIDLCSKLLESNPNDQMMLYVKCNALLQSSWVLDDTDLEEEGVVDLLLDLNRVAAMPRPGTSLTRPAKLAKGAGVRPISSCGRPLAGFQRPGTASKPIVTGSGLEVALRIKNMANDTRPASSCDARRGSTSSKAQVGKDFLDISRLDFSWLVRREPMSKVICDYLIYHEQNPRRALELCAEVTKNGKSLDWWWKARLGKCSYKLGLYRDAERHLLSSLQDQHMPSSVLELSKVYVRLDQPNTALKILEKANEQSPGETQILLGIARIHELLNAAKPSICSYKAVLSLDASNVEGLSSLAVTHFYSYQPEISLRYFRRLLQMGINGPEIWNNIGLCCFYSAQFDMALQCFGRALQLADDKADIWYNIGHIGIGIGNFELAYHSFKIAVSIDSEHAESLCNLGALETQAKNVEVALAIFRSAQVKAPHLYQPFLNGALLTYKLGNLQDSFFMVSNAQRLSLGHAESRELCTWLLRQIQTF